MRGTITKRGKNSWQVKYDLPREDGKRRQRYATVTGSRKDAQRELTRLLGAVDSGTHVDPSQTTVAAYLLAWFEGAPKVSPKTAERYRELADRQIDPAPGRDQASEAPAGSTCSDGTARCSAPGYHLAP